MTSIQPEIRIQTGLNAPIQKEPVDCSFHGRKYKWLHVQSRILYSTMMGLFYRAMSFVCGLFKLHEAANRFQSMKDYHNYRVASTKSIYHVFDKKIVNFSMNTTGMHKEGDVHKKYGPVLQEKINLAASEEIPIDHNGLQIPHIMKGICSGMSMDFISQYLHQLKNGSNPLSVVKKVSQLYVEGGTKTAQMLQIICAAQNTSQINVSVHQKIDEYFRLRGELSELFKQAKANALSKTETANFVRSTVQKYEDVYTEIDVLAAQSSERRFQASGKIVNLNVKLNKIVFTEDIKEVLAGFVEYFSGLEPGAYLLGLLDKKELKSKSPDAKHAITYIKTSQDIGFIFDPNFATLVTTKDEQASFLWDFVKKQYIVGKDNNINVYRCDLAAQHP